MDKKIMVFILAVLLFGAVVGILVYEDKHKKEKFSQCVCSSRSQGTGEICQDIDKVDLLYNTGVFTEFTDLPAPGWSTVNAGDINYPTEQSAPVVPPSQGKPQEVGCGLTAKPDKPKEWPVWDYTDFGNTC